MKAKKEVFIYKTGERLSIEYRLRAYNAPGILIAKLSLVHVCTMAGCGLYWTSEKYQPLNDREAAYVYDSLTRAKLRDPESI
jgi:hypothetical protein